MPFKFKLFFTLYLIGTFFVFSQTDTALSITAKGQQIYCVGTPIPIVTNFTIEDPDGTGVQNFFIQISGGYQMNFDELVLTGNHPTISVSIPGDYTVSAVSEAGCISEEQSLTVVNSEKATFTIQDVIIVDNSANNSIQLANPNLGIGTYAYAVDDEFGLYSDEAFFQNLSPGLYTLFVKDKKGCGTASLLFSILSFPSFFTPNEDGQNDVWKISGFNSDFYTSYSILIFDRFGKLLYNLEQNEQGWNGYYNGKPQPPNDYWFRASLTDSNGLSTEKTGNFSLIRK